MSVLLAVSSLLVGILIGSTGIGGVLLIPALVLFGGLSTHEAMATALFTFFFTGILATWIFQRHGSIDWGVALPVCAGSLVSSYFGALSGGIASARVLNLLLAGIIMASSLFPFLPFVSIDLASRLGRRGNTILLTGIGLFTGFLCGMTGAGGGIVSLPVMLICGFHPMAAIATGQILQSVVSLSGSMGNHGNGFIVFSIAWPVALCELIGVAVGVKLIHALPIALTRKIATFLCLLIGFYIAVRALA